MSVRRLRVSSLVKQPPEIDVSVGMPRIDRQRAPVRLGRLLGSGGLQLAAPPVPFLGRERPALFFLRLGKRAARDRTGAAGKIRDPEIEEDLPRLRLPPSRRPPGNCSRRFLRVSRTRREGMRAANRPRAVFKETRS